MGSAHSKRGTHRKLLQYVSVRVNPGLTSCHAKPRRQTIHQSRSEQRIDFGYQARRGSEGFVIVSPCFVS
jgi:hypothetical protein